MQKQKILIGSIILTLMCAICILRADVKIQVMEFNLDAMKEYLSQTVKINYKRRIMELTVDRTIPEKICSSAGIKSGQPIVTDDERKAGKENIDSAKSSDNMVAKYYDTKDFAQLLPGIINIVAPFVFMFIVSIFGYCCYCCCSVCDCCCPPSQCCRHALPYNKCEIIWPAVGTVITAIMFFAVGIAGLVQQKDVETGVSQVMCSLVRMVDDVRHGAESAKGDVFTGAVNLTNKMENFGGLLPAFQNDIQTSLSKTPDNLKWRTDATAISDAALQDLDAMTGQTYTNMGLSSQFQTSVWGPKTSQTTMVGIAQKFWTSMKNGLETAIDTIYNLAGPFGDQMTQIKKIIDDAVKTLGDLATTLGDLMKTADDNNETLTQFTPMITQAVSAISAFGLVVSITTWIVLIIVYFLKQRGLRRVLHVCWAIMGPIMFISLILTIVLRPAAILLADTCEVLDQTIHSEEKWDSYGVFPEMIKTCKLFDSCKAGGEDSCDGDGDLLKALKVDQELDKISGFVTDLKDAKKKSIEAPDTKKYVDDALVEYDQLQETVTYTKTHSVFQASGTNIEVPQGSLLSAQVAAINTFLARTGACTTLTEKLYYGAACGQTGYAADITSIQNNVGVNQCVQIDTYNQFSTTAEKAQDRYGGSGQCVDCTTITGNPSNCDDTFQTNMKNVMTFVSQQNSACTTAIQQFDLIQAQIQIYSDQLQATKLQVQDFIDDTIDLIDIATSRDMTKQVCIDGKCLLVDLNCLFIDTAIERVYDGVCVGFVSALINLSQVMIVFSVALFFGSFFMFCTALRNGRTQEQAQAAKVDPNIPVYNPGGQEAAYMNQQPPVAQY